MCPRARGPKQRTLRTIRENRPFSTLVAHAREPSGAAEEALRSVLYSGQPRMVGDRVVLKSKSARGSHAHAGSRSSSTESLPDRAWQWWGLSPCSRPRGRAERAVAPLLALPICALQLLSFSNFVRAPLQYQLDSSLLCLTINSSSYYHSSAQEPGDAMKVCVPERSGREGRAVCPPVMCLTGTRPEH